MKNINKTSLILSTLTATVFASFAAVPAPALAGDMTGSAAYVPPPTDTPPATGSASTTTTTDGPIDPSTIDPSQPGDEEFFAYYDDSAPETSNQSSVNVEDFAALALTLLVAPPIDPCLNNWNAVIQAKSDWLWAVGGAAVIGWLAPPVAGGVVIQKTGALINARKLMAACCAAGNAAQWSCKEAVRTNYLK